MKHFEYVDANGHTIQKITKPYGAAPKKVARDSQKAKKAHRIVRVSIRNLSA